MSEIIIINVVLGDRTYRIKVKRSDEELVRKTVKIINEKVLFFKSNFAGKDMQDFVSMALLWFATEQNKVGDFMIKEEATTQSLKNIEKLLDATLSEEA